MVFMSLNETDRKRCAKATGALPDAFNEWDLRCWLRLGEPEKPPHHQWYSPRMMESQTVCRECREVMCLGRPGPRWCWKGLEEKYKKAKSPLVSRVQIERMLHHGLITQDQVQPLLEAKWGLVP